MPVRTAVQRNKNGFSGAISTARDICQIVILLRTLGQANPIAYDRSSLILGDSQRRHGPPPWTTGTPTRTRYNLIRGDGSRRALSEVLDELRFEGSRPAAR